jgi:GDP-D-mannose dehydratase
MKRALITGITGQDGFYFAEITSQEMCKEMVAENHKAKINGDKEVVIWITDSPL